jgi:hypothetical protein
MRVPTCLAIAVSALSTACGGGAPGGGDAGTPTPDAVTTVTPPPVPYYEVPTGDPEMAAHAFFALPDVHYVTAGGIVTLTYDFPPELSGVIDQPLELSGPVAADGSSTISGPAGTGTCTVEAGIVRCLEVFGPGLQLDTAAALRGVDGYSSDPVARDLRAALITEFAQDPIGIVVFDLATASEPPGGDDEVP